MFLNDQNELISVAEKTKEGNFNENLATALNTSSSAWNNIVVTDTTSDAKGMIFRALRPESLSRSLLPDTAPGISARYVRILNKGTTFNDVWFVFDVKFIGKNIPQKIYDTQIFTDPAGALSDGTCRKLYLFDGRKSFNFGWFVCFLKIALGFIC